ncbi:MAG: lysophospholipase [Cyanobacteria bacterium]|nr:lysophospholipase [Cyanobacteriota bacterium]
MLTLFMFWSDFNDEEIPLLLLLAFTSFSLMGISILASYLETRNLYRPFWGVETRDPWIDLNEQLGPYEPLEVWIQTPSGPLLNGCWIRAKEKMSTVVLAHGNSAHIGLRCSTIEPFVKAGYGFMAFDYRGFGKSSGSPSEEGLYEDLFAVVSFLEDNGVSSDSQILIGESLGGAVVVHVATHCAMDKSFACVILYSTFTSIPDVAVHLRKTGQKKWLRYFPFQLLLNQHFDSFSKIEFLHCPFIQLHGELDTLTPLEMGKKLFQKASQSKNNPHFKKFMMVSGANHMEIFPLKIPQVLDYLASMGV